MDSTPRTETDVDTATTAEIAVRPVLADAREVARAALEELGEGKVGAHLGVRGEDEFSATHSFAAELAGYRGWRWVVVVAAPADADRATISEIALLPGEEALTAPDWKPWRERVESGDLGPGDLLPPQEQDPRLVPGYVANGDPEVDELAYEVGLGRTQVLSPEGRDAAAQRWHDGEHGPDSEMARAAASTCDRCGFYVPLSGALRNEFGVCANEFSADGAVVHARYGCGAHSDTAQPKGSGSPAFEPYDDGAVEVVTLARSRRGNRAAESAQTATDTGQAEQAEAGDTADAAEKTDTAQTDAATTEQGATAETAAEPAQEQESKD